MCRCSQMPGLVLPDDVQEFIIAADNDPDGIAWARRAAGLWTANGRRVRIAMPPPGRKDFNDALRCAA
jgi:putative DNA primase/helicase